MIDEKYIKEINELDAKLFDGIKDTLAHNSNPRWVERFKGTIFEDDPDSSKRVVTKAIMHMNREFTSNFEKAWINLFKSRDANPFSRNPNDIYSEYMDESFRLGPRAFNKEYAPNFLKIKLLEQQKVSSDKLKEKDNKRF